MGQHERESSGEAGVRTLRPATAPGNTCTVQPPTANPADCHVAATPQASRAEEAYENWSDKPYSERKLTKTRDAHAAALFKTLKGHGISDERFADMIEVSKRRAQKYLSGEDPIPTTLLDALPKPLGDEFAERLRTAQPRVVLNREIDRLDLDGLLEANERIGERLRLLTKKGT